MTSQCYCSGALMIVPFDHHYITIEMKLWYCYHQNYITIKSPFTDDFASKHQPFSMIPNV